MFPGLRLGGTREYAGQGAEQFLHRRVGLRAARENTGALLRCWMDTPNIGQHAE